MEHFGLHHKTDIFQWFSGSLLQPFFLSFCDGSSFSILCSSSNTIQPALFNWKMTSANRKYENRINTELPRLTCQSIGITRTRWSHYTQALESIDDDRNNFVAFLDDGKVFRSSAHGASWCFDELQSICFDCYTIYYCVECTKRPICDQINEITHLLIINIQFKVSMRMREKKTAQPRWSIVRFQHSRFRWCPENQNQGQY